MKAKANGPWGVPGALALAIEIENKVSQLRNLGVVVTVSLVNNKPLAMGNYHQVFDYRLDNKIYRSEK